MHLEAPHTQDRLVRLPLNTPKHGHRLADAIVDYAYCEGISLPPDRVKALREEVDNYCEQYLRTTENMIATALRTVVSEVRITHGTYVDPWYVYLRPLRQTLAPHVYLRILTTVYDIWNRRMCSNMMLIDAYTMADEEIRNATLRDM